MDGDPPAEENFDSLSIEARFAHSNWKARCSAYDEAARLLSDGLASGQIFSDIRAIIKKALAETSPAALEKGSALVVNIIKFGQRMEDNAELIFAGLASKCLVSPKSSVKSNTQDILVALVEFHELQDMVIDYLIGLFENKSPKVAASAISLFKTLLSEFGVKTISPKKALKKLSTILEAKDKNVREEAKQLTIEIQLWISDAIKPHIGEVKPVLLTELEAEFGKNSSRPVPKRLLKSQQIAASGDSSDGASTSRFPEGALSTMMSKVPDTSENDFYDPVDVTKLIPKTFNSTITSPKWQDRKEALEGLLRVLSVPKYVVTADYSVIGKSKFISFQP